MRVRGRWSVQARKLFGWTYDETNVVAPGI